VPTRRLNIVKAKPILHLIPHSNSEPALEEEVGGGFLDMIAKLTSSTILPSSSLKSIRRPNSILNDQPCKGFALQGARGKWGGGGGAWRKK
jgi:hypothetical protein